MCEYTAYNHTIRIYSVVYVLCVDTGYGVVFFPAPTQLLFLLHAAACPFFPFECNYEWLCVCEHTTMVRHLFHIECPTSQRNIRVFMWCCRYFCALHVPEQYNNAWTDSQITRAKNVFVWPIIPKKYNIQTQPATAQTHINGCAPGIRTPIRHQENCIWDASGAHVDRGGDEVLM